MDFPNVLVLWEYPRQQSEGMGALGVRHWERSDGGATHDRDVNAALNILGVGRNVRLRQWKSPPFRARKTLTGCSEEAAALPA